MVLRGFFDKDSDELKSFFATQLEKHKDEMKSVVRDAVKSPTKYVDH